MKVKKIIFAILVVALIGVMSGCVHSNNENWDDLSAQEQQEVKQALDEVKQALDDVREEIKDDFSDDTVDFALDIVDKVEEAITNEKSK